MKSLASAGSEGAVRFGGERGAYRGRRTQLVQLRRAPREQMARQTRASSHNAARPEELKARDGGERAKNGCSKTVEEAAQTPPGTSDAAEAAQAHGVPSADRMNHSRMRARPASISTRTLAA